MNIIKRKLRRQIRTRGKIMGTAVRPRMSVYRSNTSVAVQLIDDATRATIFGVCEPKDAKGKKIERAKALGLLVAEKAKEKKITKVIFDKGSYAYHGRVKAIAEGAREGGLEF